MSYESKFQREDIDELFDGILTLKDREDCYRFFEDICTVNEIHAIAQRLQVAKLLSQKKTYTEIEEETKASTATISRINKCLVYGADGYSYGQCLGFMVAVMLCAGFIEGAYMSVASNWLFAAKYDAMMSQQIGVLESTGIYTTDQLVMMTRWLRSPLVLIFSSMIGSAIKGAFFGLFIAAFTRREAQPFRTDDNSQNA